ncbi:hypothetical protein C4D60_Mb06t14470 [Musa balbisiana]|uniref:Uncharacterized protein n=1 Tax=Musa balbisiana TaxID=52838 RepID=A0A4S8IN20_MUSBA|nr:hypothetical protein C4D60_Mb06t14470 [Musa balbisiana]
MDVMNLRMRLYSLPAPSRILIGRPLFSVVRVFSAAVIAPWSIGLRSRCCCLSMSLWVILFRMTQTGSLTRASIGNDATWRGCRRCSLTTVEEVLVLLLTLEPQPSAIVAAPVLWRLAVLEPRSSSSSAASSYSFETPSTFPLTFQMILLMPSFFNVISSFVFSPSPPPSTLILLAFFLSSLPSSLRSLFVI